MAHTLETSKYQWGGGGGGLGILLFMSMSGNFLKINYTYQNMGGGGPSVIEVWGGGGYISHWSGGGGGVKF